MGKNVVFLDENEIDNRIQTAVKNAKIGNNAKIYGVSGIGQENPILVRTHDAAGVTLNIEDDGDAIECVASDVTFQEFFNFKEHTDELGNVFLTITPKSFKFDRTSNGEVTAISVKEYEDGDEEKGYMLHPFFKTWKTEKAYDGVVSREIAKYLNAAYDTANDEVYEGDCGSAKDDIVVTSKAGLNYKMSYASWADGRYIVKNTNYKYGIMHWHFVSLFRLLFLIYFATTDLFELFGLGNLGQDGDDEFSFGDITGGGDHIISHTGFSWINNVFKIFNIDNALFGITIDGCYHTNEAYYYSQLFDFDASIDEGATKSTIIPTGGFSGGDADYDTITKMEYDEGEPFFIQATAFRQATAEIPQGDLRAAHQYYCNQQKNWAPADGDRGYLIAFNYSGCPCNFEGAFFSFWNIGFNNAWYYDYCRAVRLCKSPF